MLTFCSYIQEKLQDNLFLIQYDITKFDYFKRLFNLSIV